MDADDSGSTGQSFRICRTSTSTASCRSDTCQRYRAGIAAQYRRGGQLAEPLEEAKLEVGYLRYCLHQLDNGIAHFYDQIRALKVAAGSVPFYPLQPAPRPVRLLRRDPLLSHILI